MKRGDELEITLESFAFEGKSLARVQGMVLFVHGAMPGDRARVRLEKVKKSYAEGSTLAILDPSPLRTEPRCRHFGVCGGCRWQSVAYEAQLQFKRQHVVDALERIGGFRGVGVAPTLGASQPYYYRNKMEFSFGRKWLRKEELLQRSTEESRDLPQADWALGLHIAGRFDRVLDLEECWLQSETSVRIVNLVRQFCRARSLDYYSTVTHTGYLRNLVVRQSRTTGEVMVNLVTRADRPDLMADLCELLLREVPSVTTICNNITERKSQVALGDREIVCYGPGTITEKIGQRMYRISANSFFQTNTEQAERLYDTARRMAALVASDIVYDLYSGTGTIALHVADAVARVIGVESVPAAVEDALRNAEANGVSNCHFILGDLRETLLRSHHRLQEWGKPTVMIIDPPRAGMHEDVVRRVLELSPERIVYVSCNPSTQARDLKLLASAYGIREVQPVDMFPHTYHIENVVALSR
jgi:23S rRNA (uracil1939-C5)-methyltransferase